MPQWFTWGALSLVIIRIDRGIARGRSLLQRLLLHLPLSFLVTAAFFLIGVLADVFLSRRFSAGNTSDRMLAFANVKQFFGGAFQWNYLIYWLIAGGWLAWDYNRESQDRKLQAAQLELKTTQLEQRLTEARLLNLKAQRLSDLAFSRYGQPDGIEFWKFDVFDNAGRNDPDALCIGFFIMVLVIGEQDMPICRDIFGR